MRRYYFANITVRKINSQVLAFFYRPSTISVIKGKRSCENYEKGDNIQYALILVLVAIVVIAALMILGPIIGNVFSKVNSSLSGV